MSGLTAATCQFPCGFPEVYTVTRSIYRLRPSSDDDESVQRLLATLPDPGPMPPELVGRIAASLAAEQERRGPADESVTPLVRRQQSRDQFVRRQPPQDEVASVSGPSRSLLLGLGGAAAAFVVGGVVVVNALTPAGAASDPSTYAQLSLGEPGVNAPADPHDPMAPLAPTGPAAPDAGAPGPGDPANQGETGSYGVPGAGTAPGASVDAHITVSARQYTTADLAAQGATLWRAPGAPLHTMAAEAPSIGPIGTTGGVAECLAAIGANSGTSRAIVDLAFLDGAPAAVIVTQGDQGTQVRAVTRQCGSASDQVLAGPFSIR